MSKIGFEMCEEERALTILDTVLDVNTANFSEGFVGSVLTREEANKLTDLLIKADDIVRDALKRFPEV